MANLFSTPVNGGGGAVEKIFTYNVPDGDVLNFTIPLGGYDFTKYSKIEIVFRSATSGGGDFRIWFNGKTTDGDYKNGYRSSNTMSNGSSFGTIYFDGLGSVFSIVGGGVGLYGECILNTSAPTRGMTTPQSNITFGNLTSMEVRRNGSFSPNPTGVTVTFYGYLL